MPINPTYLANIPETVAMPVMVGFLLSMRNRHPKLDTRSWVAALVFIFLAQVTWVMQGHPELQLGLMLNGQLLAGLAFATYRGTTKAYEGFDLIYMAVNGVTLVLLECLYAWGVHDPWKYLCGICLALAVLAASTWWRRQNVHRAMWVSFALVALAVPAGFGWYECVAYWVLAGVYAYAGWHFKSRLPEKTVGKIAMLTSMALLTVCYLGHPWVLRHHDYIALADQLWRMQKFFVAVGMLLVLVENQSARHQYQAMHDQLTGIPNRRMLDSALKSEIEWAQRAEGRLTLFMIDLNGFKAVNDTHGHLAGDHVLHEVSRRVRQKLRATELVARMGGDEFVVLTRAAVSDDSISVMEAQLRKWIREPIEWDGKRLRVDGSMGTARFPEDVARWSDDVSQDPAEKLAGAMLRIADMKMYRQKPSSKKNGAELEQLFPVRAVIQ